jgi:hypothetical protein
MTKTPNRWYNAAGFVLLFAFLFCGAILVWPWSPGLADQVDLRDYAKIHVGRTTEAEVVQYCGLPDYENIIQYEPYVVKRFTYFPDPDSYRKIKVIITISAGIVARKERLYD